MGFHFSAIAIERGGSVSQEPPGFVRVSSPQRTYDFGEAISSNTTSLSIGQVGDWSVIIDPTCGILPEALTEPGSIWDRRLIDLSKTNRSVVFVEEGYSSTYGFALYEGGACIRRWLYIDAEVIENDGTPLTVEASMQSIEDGEVFLDFDFQVLLGSFGISLDILFDDAEYAACDVAS